MLLPQTRLTICISVRSFFDTAQWTSLPLSHNLPCLSHSPCPPSLTHTALPISHTLPSLCHTHCSPSLTRTALLLYYTHCPPFLTHTVIPTLFPLSHARSPPSTLTSLSLSITLTPYACLSHTHTALPLSHTLLSLHCPPSLTHTLSSLCRHSLPSLSSLSHAHCLQSLTQIALPLSHTLPLSHHCLALSHTLLHLTRESRWLGMCVVRFSSTLSPLDTHVSPLSLLFILTLPTSEDERRAPSCGFPPCSIVHHTSEHTFSLPGPLRLAHMHTVLSSLSEYTHQSSGVNNKHSANGDTSFSPSL